MSDKCPEHCECGEPRMTMSHENTVATYRCGRGGQFHGDDWHFDNLPICAQRQLAQVRADNQILRVDLETMTRTAANQGDRAGKAEADNKETRLRMDIRDRGNVAALEEIARQAEKAEADARRLREVLEPFAAVGRIVRDEGETVFDAEEETDLRHYPNKWIAAANALAAKPQAPSEAIGEASVEKRCGTCDFWTPGRLKIMGECGVEMEGTTIDKVCPFNMWKPKQGAKEAPDDDA